jgi:hypothetical protein
VIALAALTSATGGEGGLVEGCPGLARTAEYRRHVESPLGLSLTYGDNGQEELNADPHLGWLARRFEQPAAGAHARALLDGALARLERRAAAAGGTSKPKNKFDRLWALHALWLPGSAAGAPAAPPPLDARFRGVAELAFFRAAWGDARAAWVGVKAGANGHHHGHMDLGAFQLDALGQRWVADFGSDDYNLPEYNSRLARSRRWRYLRAGNRGHSTLTAAAGGLARVAGAMQGPAARAPISAFHSAPAGAHAVVDGDGVYAGVAWARGVALLPGRARVLVQDELRPAAGAAAGALVGAAWRLFTRASVRVEAGGRAAVLALGGEALRATLLEPAGAAWAVGGAAPADVPGPPFAAKGGGGGSEEESGGGEGEEGGGELGAGAGADPAGGGELTEKQREKREARRAARREAKGRAPAAATHVPVKEVRRGVLRSSVAEDANEGFSLLCAAVEFAGAAGGRIAVLLEPVARGEEGKAPPPLRPLAEWEGRVVV